MAAVEVRTAHPRMPPLHRLRAATITGTQDHPARRHGEPIDPRYGGMDPFSSAWWFDGWSDPSWRVGIPPPELRTVAAAETWLLRVGWKRSTYGLLSIAELPPAGRR